MKRILCAVFLSAFSLNASEPAKIGETGESEGERLEQTDLVDAEGSEESEESENDSGVRSWEVNEWCGVVDDPFFPHGNGLTRFNDRYQMMTSFGEIRILWFNGCRFIKYPDRDICRYIANCSDVSEIFISAEPNSVRFAKYYGSPLWRVGIWPREAGDNVCIYDGTEVQRDLDKGTFLFTYHSANSNSVRRFVQTIGNGSSGDEQSLLLEEVLLEEAPDDAPVEAPETPSEEAPDDAPVEALESSSEEESDSVAEEALESSSEEMPDPAPEEVQIPLEEVSNLSEEVQIPLQENIGDTPPRKGLMALIVKVCSFITAGVSKICGFLS